MSNGTEWMPIGCRLMPVIWFRDKGIGEYWIRWDMRNPMWDAGQIVEDLIPISRQDGGVLIGDMRG
jgi:hypothetical protein